MARQSLIALELADAGLVAVGPSGRLGRPSPGFAHVRDGVIAVGHGAAARRRIEPRATVSDFWSSIDLTPVGPPFPPGARNADLIHAHLAALAAEVGSGEVLLALPGARSEAEIALLLGIARAAGLTAAGLVDAAVAAVALAPPPAGRVVHVEVELHRAVVTTIEVGDGTVRRRQVLATAPGTGLAAIEDRWAAKIADRFMRETRFDPLHAGIAEQALHDAIPAALAEAERRGAARVALAAGSGSREVEIGRAALVEAVADLYAGIVRLTPAGAGQALVLTSRAAALPGLGAALAEVVGAAAGTLAPGAAAASALARAGEVRSAGEALRFVTRLRLADATAAVSPAAAATVQLATRPATHLVRDGVAVALGGTPLLIGSAPEGVGRALVVRAPGIEDLACRISPGPGGPVLEEVGDAAVWLNGKRLKGSSPLAAGDRLRLGDPGVTLEAVAVEGPA